MSEPQISRRTLLAGAAATSVVAALPKAAFARQTPHRELRRSVVVLGTGFGGSVTALRLAQAGVRVTMVERGRRWAVGQRGTFPGVGTMDHRAIWLGSGSTVLPGLKPFSDRRRYAGLVEAIQGKGIVVACGAAVGGGSLPYHGMSVQPRGDLFARVMPAALDYEQFDQEFYPRAAAMLKISAMPQDVLDSPQYSASRTWQSFVAKAGLPAARPLPMTIDWDAVRREIRGESPPWFSSGDVLFGVNGPGKQSLDTNYIPAAEATGNVELLELHHVQDIARDRRGRWVLDIHRINRGGTLLERITLTTDALFLGAGSPNTSKLLVHAAARDTISGLPDGVGTQWGTNGDLIVGQLLPKPMGGLGGPASVASCDWDNPEGPVTVLYAPVPIAPRTDSSAYMQTVAMYLPDKLGAWVYDARKDEAIVELPGALRTPAAAAGMRRLNKVARAAGALGTIDLTGAVPNTFHALGGATIGTVCDDYGRVLEQPGLYVTDGALIPGSTACANPSLTIAALAERNVQQVLRRDLGAAF
ncbi:MAG: FAD-dependent oxidoreductase [Solirubrobacteraceae bacterium]|nr:FAD-dependent oxidoreductase [Solirubrobacteraceae bacterium]